MADVLPQPVAAAPVSASARAAALARLMQLSSPTLPVGAFSYSQGLESALEAGWIRDAATAGDWIESLGAGPYAQLEAPLWWRAHAAWQAGDAAALQAVNDLHLASREGAELRAEALQMGWSLARLARDLGAFGPAQQALLPAIEPPGFLVLHAGLAWAWDLDPEEALLGHAWSWAENQVMAAVKLIPLGQTEGQRLLLRLGDRLPDWVATGRTLAGGGEAALGGLAPGLGLAASRHEVQINRIFRS